MPNFVSTNTPAASGPAAMNLLALKQRLAEQQAQQAQISRPHVVTSPMQGLGDLANAFFTARRGDYLQQQEAATRDTLAKMRAGWAPEGPTPAQAAAYSQLDPEEGNKVADQSIQAAQAKATADTLFGHQQTLQTQAEGATSGLEKQREAFQAGQTPVLKDLPDDYKQQHGLPPGAKVDQYGNVVVPNVGEFGQPLQPTEAVGAGAAADFVANAPALIDKINKGGGTEYGPFSGMTGFNAVRNAVNEGVSELMTLNKIDPTSPEGKAMQAKYGTHIGQKASDMADNVKNLAEALKSARSGIATGRSPTAVPGGGPDQTSPQPSATKGEPVPDDLTTLKVGTTYFDGESNARYKGGDPHQGSSWEKVP